jgi:hypothetical protein
MIDALVRANKALLAGEGAEIARAGAGGNGEEGSVREPAVPPT